MTIFKQTYQQQNTKEKNLALRVRYLEEDTKVYNRPTQDGELFGVMDGKAFKGVLRKNSLSITANWKTRPSTKRASDG